MRVTLVGRSLVVFLVTGLFIGVVGGSALATSDTGTQNPDLTVTATVSNEGGGEDSDTDTVTAGEWVTASGSVTNNSSKTQVVDVTVTLTYPSGDREAVTDKIALRPGQTRSYTYTYTVDPSDDKGTYALTAAASNRDGTSSATAEIEVY